MYKRSNLINMPENRIFPILSDQQVLIQNKRSMRWEPAVIQNTTADSRSCALRMETLFGETDNTSDIYQISLLSYLQQYRTMLDTHKWTCLNLVNHKYPTPHNARYSMNNQCHTCTEHVMGAKAGSQRDIIVLRKRNPSHIDLL